MLPAHLPLCTPGAPDCPVSKSSGHVLYVRLFKSMKAETGSTYSPSTSLKALAFSGLSINILNYVKLLLCLYKMSNISNLEEQPLRHTFDIWVVQQSTSHELVEGYNTGLKGFPA